MPETAVMRVRPGGVALVGRDTELEELVAACSGVACRTIVVEGEAGSGKTRLLEKAASRAIRRGHRVLRGHAVPGAGPFRPLAQALTGVADPAMAALPRVAPFAAVLARLLPAWPAGPAAGVHLVDPIVVLGEALGELFDVLTGQMPTVLMLDDLHWADPATLGVLEYLAGRVSALPVLVSARSDEDQPEGLNPLRRHRAVATVRLERLDTAQVSRLAAVLLGGELDPAAREYLAQASDGVPLMVEELCADLAESGTLCRREGRWRISGGPGPRPPAALAGAVACRIAALDPDDARVVRYAALLGRDLRWELVPEVAGVSPDAAAQALRVAVQARLLVEVPGAGLRWRHALTQDAVLDTLTPPERAVLAARAAAVLDRPMLSGSRLSLVADLYARAGNTDRAVQLLLDHACEHRDAGAPDAALAVLDRAAELDARVVEVAIVRVEVLALTARTDDALAVGVSLLEAASGPSRTALAVGLARACVTAERFTEAADLLARAEDPHDPRVCALGAHVALGTGDVAAALLRAEAALGVPDAPPEAVCEAYEAVGRGHRRADPARAHAAHRQAERVAAEHGLTAWRLRALSELGAEDMLGTGDGAALRQARELAAAAGMVGTVTMLDLQLTACCYGIEGPVAAMVLADACAERAGRLGLGGQRAHALLFAARGRVFAGRGGEAGPLLDEAAVLAPNPIHVHSSRHLVRAHDAWLARRGDAVVPDLDEAVDLLRRQPGSNPAPSWGERALLRTIADPADRGPRDELRASDVLVNALNRASLHYCDAVAACAAGADPAPALSAAEAIAVTRPFQRCLLRAFLLDGEVLGDPAPVLNGILATLAGSGETRLLSWCRDRLRELGAPVPRPGRDSGPVPPRLRARGVTGRELEVLELVAAGLGNPAIADRLRLSRRTVETHVGHLLAKTGSGGRAELALWLDR